MKFSNHSDDESWKKAWMEFFSIKSRRTTYNPHSIPVVPEELQKFVEKKEEFRKSNENAHIPKLISIGPRHRGRSELQRAEGIKWRCITSLLYRVAENNSMKLLEKCLEDILKLDAAVRTSYGDEINLDRFELANVMLFDGFFLLELLLSVTDPNDPTGWKPTGEMKNMEHVLSDLMLVENQLPVVVLETLVENLFPEEYFANMIQSRALYFFGISGDDPLNPTSYAPFAYHFLDIAFVHIINCIDERQNQQRTAQRLQQAQHLNRCATRLEAVGITIKCLSNTNTSSVPNTIFQFFTHDIKFDKSSNGRIILEIPQLDITQITQLLALWKSFIAWEIHKSNVGVGDPNLFYEGTFTSYAILFNDLICCTSDVQLLKNKGVIVNNSGNKNRDIVDFFRSIGLGIDRGRINPVYGNMFHELNTHSSSPANYATKYIILLFHYFCRISDWAYNLRNFLKRDYNFVATLLAILTVVQTCYTIVSYHDPRKS